MAAIDKHELHASLLGALGKERDVLVAAQRATRDGVVHEDNRSEGDKDMRSTEASYLARGQALRVEALEADVDRVRSMALRAFGDDDPIALSAVVALASESAKTTVFVAPAGGGITLSSGGSTVQVVTPASPLGRSLVGARKGDVVEVERGGGTVEFEVTDVA